MGFIINEFGFLPPVKVFGWGWKFYAFVLVFCGLD